MEITKLLFLNMLTYLCAYIHIHVNPNFLERIPDLHLHMFWETMGGDWDVFQKYQNPQATVDASEILHQLIW